MILDNRWYYTNYTFSMYLLKHVARNFLSFVFVHYLLAGKPVKIVLSHSYQHSHLLYPFRYIAHTLRKGKEKRLVEHEYHNKNILMSHCIYQFNRPCIIISSDTSSNWVYLRDTISPTWGLYESNLTYLCFAGKSSATFVSFFGTSKCPHHGKDRT